MAMPRQIKIEFGEAFPYGALAVGEVEPLRDFNAAPLRNGERPQAKDEETGLLMWSVDVMDADPEVRKANRTVSVKVAAKVQPVLPELPAGTPAHLAFMRPVEFTGLTASPYVADSPMGNGKGRLAWSFRAKGMQAPSVGGSTSESGAAGGSGPARPSKKEAA